MIQQLGLLLVNGGNIFEGCIQGFICLWHLHSYLSHCLTLKLTLVYFLG